MRCDEGEYLPTAQDGDAHHVPDLDIQCVQGIVQDRELRAIQYADILLIPAADEPLNLMQESEGSACPPRHLGLVFTSQGMRGNGMRRNRQC